MKCTAPLKAYYRKGEKLKFVQSFSDLEVLKHDGQFQSYQRLELPCGQCLACRVTRASQWALRCQHEKYYYEKASFLTLTYAPKYCPDELIKADLQKFIKRLRKYYSNISLRYFACGEYGSKLQRPHYHLIVFGVDFSEDRYIWRTNKLGKNPLYRSPTLEKLWPYGYSTIGNVTFESSAYVARYCSKKINGKQKYDHYTDDETGLIRTPEFQLQSLKPGIGQRFFEEFGQHIFEVGYCLTHNKSKIAIPRYYRKLCELNNPELYDDFKKRIELYSNKCKQEEKSILLDEFKKLNSTDEYYLQLQGLEDITSAIINEKAEYAQGVILSKQEEINIRNYERLQDELDNFLLEQC